MIVVDLSWLDWNMLDIVCLLFHIHTFPLSRFNTLANHTLILPLHSHKPPFHSHALSSTLFTLLFKYNTGKFEENGRSGYVLKPPLMTATKKTFNPFDILPIEDVVPLSISVQVRLKCRTVQVHISRNRRTYKYKSPTRVVAKKRPLLAKDMQRWPL